MNAAQETLPASFYGDPLLYKDEREKIFGQSWQLVGHESQLRNPGDYVATTFAEFPLLLMRDEKNSLHAFHNVCRHRAGPLVEKEMGNCGKELTCRYHGWQFTLDGRLRNARDFGRAEGFNVKDFPLFRLKCENWRGFIFVNKSDAPSPLSALTAPLDEKTGTIPLHDFTFDRIARHTIKCNWKTYVENYLEGYHIPIVHLSLNDMIDSANYAVHAPGPVIFQDAPSRDGAPVTGLWAWAWPCLGVNFYNDVVMMERMWPVGHDETRLEYLYLRRKDVDPDTVEKKYLGTSLVITQEDVDICEAVQRNLNAGIYKTGRLSPRHEQGVAWFQNHYRHVMGLN